MQQQQVESALEPIRSSMNADGFDLRLGSLSEEGVATVVLEALPDACLDCLVPEPVMVQILDDAIRTKEPAVTRVKIVRVGFENATH